MTSDRRPAMIERMRQLARVLRLVGVLAAVLVMATLTVPAHADDPPWSPAGFDLTEAAPYTLDGDDRCREGERWHWTGAEGEIVLILLPCTNQADAQAAAQAQVLFADDEPEQRVLGVEHVSWSESDRIAMRVWVQESTVVVLAAQATSGSAADSLDLGATHAPDLAESLPGEPLPPQTDGYGVQGILVTVPLVVWLVLVLPARAIVALRRPRYDATGGDPGWRDITSAATLVTHRRRWRRAGWWVAGLSLGLIAFGIANTAIGEIADGVPRGLAGIAGTVGGVVMIRRNSAHPVEQAARLPTTRGVRAWFGSALSVLAYGLAVAIVLGTATAAVTSVILPPASRIPTLADIVSAGADAPVVLLITVALLIREALLAVLVGMVLTLVAVAGIDALGRRLRAASLREVLVADPRAPILYLRSFDEDRLTLPATLHRRGLMDTLNVLRRRRFEEAIVVQLQRAGPVVAIAPPGSRLPKVGAARASFRHDEWQDEVTELAQRASAVVLSATPDSVREGFGWEIELVASRLAHGRVIVVVGPWRAQLKRRWEGFRAHVATLPFFADLAEAELPDGLHVAAHSSRWGWSSWGATRRTDVTYAVAIDHALHALEADMKGVDDDPDAVDPLLAGAP